MARTREFDPDELLLKAVQVFWKNGYADTSMRDIVEATGVAHAGLYAAFGSKRDLYKTCLERYSQRFADIAFKPLEDKHSDLSHVHRFFDVVLQGIEDGRFATGCLIGNTVIEFGSDSSDVLNFSRRFIERLNKAFGVALNHAQAAGQLPETKNPDVLAQLLTTYFYGLMTMVRSGMPPKKIRKLITAIHFEIG